MIEISTTIATARVKWTQAAAGTFTNQSLYRAFQRIGLKLQRNIMLSASGDLLQKRTGNLTRAVFYRVEGSLTSAEILVRAGVDLLKAVYGRIQNFGGTIKPRNAKFLTIPVGRNVTPNGVMRVNAREFIANPGSLGFTGSFVNRRKTAIMGVRANGEVEPVFALKTQVTIKPTGYITGSLDKTESYIKEQLHVVGTEIVRDIADGQS